MNFIGAFLLFRVTPARCVRPMSDAARDAPRVRHRISASAVFEPRNAAELSSFRAIARAGGMRCGATRSRRRAAPFNSRDAARRMRRMQARRRPRSRESGSRRRSGR
ncbi:hypothetical protein F9948_05715 [Burkholderia thailandensis]|nr:hypothetical protein [Burkholderia thailandensis]MDD1487000.1 hypothetical protein [Burkholderia thailandensis]MDD1492543.1 hypothetical protein [Burkholderia thailandensis]TGB24574.1 hypothetical protein C6946_31500 [Burkholderia thailandensis]